MVKRRFGNTNQQEALHPHWLVKHFQENVLSWAAGTATLLGGLIVIGYYSSIGFFPSDPELVELLPLIFFIGFMFFLFLVGALLLPGLIWRAAFYEELSQRENEQKNDKGSKQKIAHGAHAFLLTFLTLAFPWDKWPKYYVLILCGLVALGLYLISSYFDDSENRWKSWPRILVSIACGALSFFPLLIVLLLGLRTPGFESIAILLLLPIAYLSNVLLAWRKLKEFWLVPLICSILIVVFAPVMVPKAVFSQMKYGNFRADIYLDVKACERVQKITNQNSSNEKNASDKSVSQDQCIIRNVHVLSRLGKSVMIELPSGEQKDPCSDAQIESTQRKNQADSAQLAQTKRVLIDKSHILLMTSPSIPACEKQIEAVKGKSVETKSSPASKS
ncbi:MAG: hypothetical protein D6732_13785 [Methanobacteriota archaeon]|nr:MAG: hypothetical protein D6732_13785 [Euryarchaeota archaeon]